MARLINVGDDYRERVADNLGAFLASADKVFGGTNLEALQIDETFPIVRLPDMRPSAGVDLKDQLVESGALHHQVSRSGTPIGFSVSHDEQAAEAVIDRFTTTAEAAVILDVIQVVDRSDIGDAYIAKILDDRIRNLGAIVLTSEGDEPSLVIPFRVPLEQNLLASGQLYTSDEFVDALARLPTAGGLVVDPESSAEGVPNLSV
jgi:hypothetical protein